MRKIKILFLLIILTLLHPHCTIFRKNTKTKNKEKQNANHQNLKVSEHYAEGIRILQAYHPTDLVVAKIYITGGVQFYEKEQEGIELLTLKLATSGSSQHYDKKYLDERLEKLGSHIEVSSGYDYSVITLTCLKEHFFESLQILMEKLLYPKFSATEFLEVRDRYMVELLERERNPWEQLRNWSLKHYFQESPLSINPLGTYQSLFSFTNEDLYQFYQNLLTRNRIYVVVVGKIPVEELSIQYSLYLSNLPEGGTISPSKIPSPYYTRSNVEFQKREGTLSYINGIFNAPKPGTLEALVLQIALAILNERLQTKLVFQKGLLSEVFCGYAEFSTPIANIRFSTSLPSLAVRTVMEELYKLRAEGVTKQELHQKKQFFLTQYYQKLAYAESYASIIGNATFHHSWKGELQSVQKLESITNKNVLAVLQKYLKNIQWYFIGDVNKIGKGAFEKGSF